MRIALVQCPIWSTAMPPLGLASLQAWLNQLGHQVRVTDLNISLSLEEPETYIATKILNSHLGIRGMFVDSMVREPDLGPRWELLPDSARGLQAHTEKAVGDLLEFDPDVIGFSVQWNSLPLSLAYCRTIRQSVGAQPYLVWGGPACGSLHPFVQLLVDRGLLDACVVGEGEEVARTLFGGAELDGAIISSTYSPRVMSFQDFDPPEMNGLPTPDFTGLPLDQYSDHCIPVLSSRGCVARCTFCDERWQWHGYRQRDADAVVADLLNLSGRHGNNVFRFNDSLINGDIQWLRDFTDVLRDTGLKVKWFGNARVHPQMNAELFERLYAAGCWELLFGIESGSSSVLRQMRKGITSAMASKVLADCSKSNIRTHTYWIFGSPTERIEDLHESLRFLQTHINTVDSVYFHLHSPSRYDTELGRRWGDNRIRLNIPLFRSLFLHVMQAFSVSASWIKSAGDDGWVKSRDAARQAHLRHPRRSNAALLLAVIAGGLDKLEHGSWHVIGNDSSYLNQTDLTSKNVLLMLSDTSNGAGFVQKLIEASPSFVVLHWLGDWSDVTIQQLSDLSALLSSNGIGSRISPGQHSCVREQPDAVSTDGCDACAAIKYISCGEAHDCCRLVRSSLGLEGDSMDAAWDRRREVYESFVSHLCQMRRSQKCEACLGDHSVCPRTCCSGQAIGGVPETIYTDWY